MKKSEFTERLQAIGTEEDDVKRRDLIAQLIEEGGNDYDEHAAAVASRDQLQKDNEDLRAANMRLFKQIGDDPDPDPDPKPEKRKFENLFNEKGGIK